MVDGVRVSESATETMKPEVCNLVCTQKLRPAEGNTLGRRAALIRVMKDAAVFLGELYESLAKAELKVMQTTCPMMLC